MQDLQGKLALVTGGAKGIGKVIAQKLAARGAHVIINFFHSLDEAKRTRDELTAAGAQVEIIRASVSRQDQVERMFAEIEQRHGHLDILVNNAAAGAMVPMSEVSEEYFDRALGTNLKGAFWCARHAARLMQKRGGGTIVNLSSIGSFLAVPNYTVVGTSKAALEALTRYLAAEFAPLNIRVNAASAGMVDTDVVRHFPDHAQMRERIVQSTPLGRVATPDDLADVVMFLTADASRWIVGQTILADGGMSLGTSAFVPPPAVPVTAPIAEQQDLAEPPQAAARAPLILVETQKNAEPGVESEDVAIVGIGLALPGARNAEQFWDILMNGPQLFETVPDNRWRSENFYSANPATEDKNYSLYSAFVKEPVTSAADPKAGTPCVDGSVRWLRHALDQAMHGVQRRDADRLAFVVGYTPDGNQCLEESYIAHGYAHRLGAILEKMEGDREQNSRLAELIKRRLQARYRAGASSPADFLPEISGRKAMQGLLPADTELLMVDTACSSSLYAVDIGVKGLLMGKSEIAVCSGAFALAPLNGVLFSKLGGLARGGAVRSLDKDSDGVLFSDGAGVVVLKRLQRARQDGDRIFGVIKAFGSSSDGRGKAIYAPALEGQRLALRRAHAHPGYQGATVDWVLAHATGTPAGDRTELESVRSSFPSDRKLYVTSNKSVIGHTGWAAGVASLIQSVLAFEHQVIPPQHGFSAPPSEFANAKSSISIPRTAQPWPRSERPRHAAISSFGFGGTNAHLLVSENDPTVAPTPPVQRPYHERIALVAWAAHVPGLATAQAVEQWMQGAGVQPDASFGTFYPAPPFERVRMPPKTVRTVDRAQLMILACAQTLLVERLGSLWESTRESTGVFLGHMGKTRQAILYGHRIYLDDVHSTLAADPAIARTAHFEEAFAKLRSDIKLLVPPANEDSFPGLMPNVIPARVASFFDLKGLTLACDAGFASTLVAFELGARYLRSGELDLAIVGGINGNSGWEADETLRGIGSTANTTAGEGAFLFAIARESTARERGLPILAYVDSADGPRESASTVECGLRSPSAAPRLNYMGADSGWAVLQALHGGAQRALVHCRNGIDGNERWLSLERPVPTSGRQLNAEVIALPAPAIRAAAPAEAAPAPELALARMTPYWDAMPAQSVTASTPWLPAGTVLLTDAPQLVESLGTLPKDLIVLSIAALPRERAGWFHVPDLDATEVSSLLAQHQGHRHLRVIADLEGSAPAASALATPAPSLMALSDLILLALKAMYERLTTAESSFVSLLLGAWQNGVLHPFAGVFGGMIKSAWLELGPALSYGVFTSTRDPRAGAQEAQSESSARRLMAVVGYDGGTRVTLRARAEAIVQSSSAPPLDEQSVVLAVGGARGISAEILNDLARRYRPHIFIVGSNDLDAYPQSAFAGSDEAFARSRADFLRERRAQSPQASIAALSVEFDRMANARAARRNLDKLARVCGAGKVHYRSCNVLDRGRLAAVVAELLPANSDVDVVINAAGINRASSIPMKSLETFRSVRDLKVLGYQNLRHALRSRGVRSWFNFGSFVGFTGQVGELDYAAGNDFLSTASAAASRLEKTREVTICWTVWGEVGMVESHPLTSSRTKSSGRYTSMTTAEGLLHFHRELSAVGTQSSVVLMGEIERRSIVARVPDYFDEPAAVPESAGFKPGFYIDRILRSEPDLTVFERTFSLARDAYLSGHVVNGHPTLPGTFVPELAAEAALALFPEMKVVAFEDLRFAHFLRVYGDSPAPKRIEARIVEQTASRIVVSVRVLTDVLGPNGHVLMQDKLHFSARVILMPQYAIAPQWEPWDSAGEIAVPDPYHLDKAPVRLSGVFVTTRDTRIHPMGKRAAYACQVSADDAAFSRFVTPCLMMDGLARVGVLHLCEEDYLPVAAPATIRRIDLYQGANDCVLASTIPAGGIQLYVTPTGMILGGGDRENRCVAVAPDGHMLLQMKGISGTIIGYVHRRTGEFITPQAMERLQEAGASRATTTNPASQGVAPVTRVRWRPMPIRQPGGEPGRLAGSNVLVLGGADELAAAVVRRLRLLGAVVTRCDDASSAAVADYVHGVIDLSPCGPLPQGHERPWEPLLDRSVRVLKALWEPWSREVHADRIFYMPVTALGGLMGYDGHAVALPYGGIWAGLAKSLPREIPNCNVKVLDVADVTPDAVANLIAEELGAWDLFEVGYRNGQRYGLLAANEAAGAAQLSLGGEDTVLISGGGRGIGFGVAEALARRTGCRVIVTGRSALPAPSEPWLAMSDEDFRGFANDRLKAGAAARNVAQVKAQLDTLTQNRALSTNLRRVRADGLRIDYAVCDFNHRDAVQALVQSLGRGLTGVIHNAGIDTPVRLSAKTPESFIATVRVKIAGFVNLLQALADADLKFFCNVGSIAGRLGGMAGQTDYAAGNDGLARLGFWAQSQVKFPVKTVCWPTWNHLGLIANFDAAVKYMTAMEAEEGVTLWIDEILQGGSGEICYPGRPGPAVSPLELKGFRLVTPDFPSFDMLYSRSVYLGTMLEHRRARSMRTRASIDPRVTPMLREFLVGGQAAVPVSMLLEYALALAADEIVPENWPAMRLHEVRNCLFETAGLALAQPDAPFVFEREATGRWHSKRWLVDVTFAEPSARRPFGRVQLVFERDDPAAAAQPAHLNLTAIEPVSIDNARGLTWRSIVLDGGQWARSAAGELVGKVRRRLATDVWALPYVPHTRLPGHLIEAALRASAWDTANAGAAVRIGFERLRLVSDGQPVRAVGKLGEATFTFVDDSSSITHTLEKITLQTRSSQNKKVAIA